MRPPFFRPWLADLPPSVSTRLLVSVTSRDGGDHILPSSSSVEKDGVWGLKTNQREVFAACDPDSSVRTVVVVLWAESYLCLLQGRLCCWSGPM